MFNPCLFFLYPKVIHHKLSYFSVNWINPAKTLREQGIDENEPVLLRRKFFFSDGNIDTHDPIQLNLLYVQVRVLQKF